MATNSPLITLLKKLQNVVLYIFPPFISVLYLSIPKEFNLQYVTTCLGFIFSALIISAFGYFINDATDIKTDEAAGKRNIASKYSLTQRIFISIALLFLGLTIFYLSIERILPFLILLLQILALFIYSIPPFRTKNNSILGPVTDAHYGHILPVFIAITTFLTFGWEHWLLLQLLYLLLFTKGLRNILLHQLDDRKTDRITKINTFPIKKGPVATLNLINRFILPTEFILICISLVIIFPSYPFITYGFGIFLIFTFCNFSGWKFFKLPPRQLRFKFLFFLNDFYELWLPLLCIWSTDLDLYFRIGLTILHLIIFYPSTKKFMKDVGKIFKNFGLYKAN